MILLLVAIYRSAGTTALFTNRHARQYIVMYSQSGIGQCGAGHHFYAIYNRQQFHRRCICGLLDFQQHSWRLWNHVTARRIGSVYRDRLADDFEDQIEAEALS